MANRAPYKEIYNQGSHCLCGAFRKTVPGLPEEEELLWKMPVIHAPGRSASVFTVALMIAHPTDTGRRFVRTLSTVCANWQAN